MKLYNIDIKKITQRINQEYWDSYSDTSHSIYVGSYGRNTEIKTSDIDIVVWLPNSVKERFDKRSGNKQSQFLTEVIEKLQKIYWNYDNSSDI